MSIKGGVFDASGQPISSVRIVTDADALAGLGTSAYPIRTDPVGTTVQPVSIASGSVSITGPATVTANQGTPGGTAWPVSAASLPLPAGAALDSSLATLHADLATLDTDLKSTQPRSVTGTVSVSNFPVTQPVNGTVAVSNFPATQPVSGTVNANAGANLNTSLLALEAGGNLASIKADVDKIPSQGQALAAASMPVVLPATQITTLTPPAAITGFALEVGGNLASIKADVDKIPSQGQALSAASMPVVLPATQIATLTPPASVGVNNFPATQAVSGTFFQTTQPISAAALPLPANASQETGGNLATLTMQTRNDAQIVDMLAQILAQLRLLNMNFASCAPSAYVDQDGMVMDIFPLN